MALGRELLDVPFAEMVHNLALAIAQGQLELDRSAINTLAFLVDPANSVDLVTEITDVITSVPRTATVPGTDEVVSYTGAQVTSSGAAPVRTTLFQAGLSPTFYQFTEATIEVKMAISIREGEPEPTGAPRIGSAIRLHSSPVDFRTSNTFSYTAQGSSVLRATLRPVPAPSRVTPRTVTVDATTQPPRVTVTA
jgi:hypothetical protein